MNSNKFVAFDVDGTLITQNKNGEDIPRYEVIELFHHFYGLGCTMIIWSGSGEDYAMRWAKKLGLKASVIKKGSLQVDIAVDDMEVELGIVNLKV